MVALANLRAMSSTTLLLRHPLRVLYDQLKTTSLHHSSAIYPPRQYKLSCIDCNRSTAGTFTRRVSRCLENLSSILLRPCDLVAPIIYWERFWLVYIHVSKKTLRVQLPTLLQRSHVTSGKAMGVLGQVPSR
jgi:hypothetical protein